MAFRYYTGVQIGKGSDWDSVSNPDELTNAGDQTKGIGAVRTIHFTPSDSITSGAARLQNMRNPGPTGTSPNGIKHIIVTIHPANGNWSSLPLATWQTQVTDVVNGMKGKVDAWSIGNEPAADAAGAVGGPYWPRFRAAANICHSLDPGTPVVLAAPWTTAGIAPFFTNANTDFHNNGLDIRDYADAWDLHLYGHDAAANLAQAQARRAQVDGFANPPTGGGSYAAMPLYVTESGWTCYSPGPYKNAVPPGDTAGTDPDTQSGNMRRNFENFRDNRTALKLRAAIWYIWQDIDSLKTSGGGYMGAKKARFTESTTSPPTHTPLQPGVDYPSPVAKSPNGYRPSKTVLLSFFKVYDAAAAAPPVVTTTTPAINITQNSATLKGTVNPQGQATTFYFDYGPTVAYGSTTTGASAGSGSAAVNVQANVTGLTPGTTYHFRCRATNADGTTLGSIDRTFATAAPPLAPTVSTGPVTGLLPTSATIWGSINPNGLAVTNYHFEYGITTAYGTNAPAGTLPAGTAGNLVAAALTGLVGGTTYHYRLVATNSAGTTNGVDRSFILTAPPSGTAPELSRVSVLSTLLSAEITTADRQSYRWDIEDSDVHNRPLEISFATQQGDGFAEASCTLPRPINLDWADLHLLDRLRFIGADGSIAYEGRVASMPRRVGSDGEMIEVQAQGLMASARDRTFTDIIVDRSGDRWQEPSLALRKATLAADFPLDADYTTTIDSGSIMFKGTTNKQIPVNSQTCVEYIAPSGVKLASFQYTGTEKNISNEGTPNLRTTDDDSIVMSSWGTNALTLDGTGTIQTASPAAPVSIFGLRLACAVLHGDGTNPAAPAHRHYEKIAVYSDHGIELQSNGNDPDGVWASDVIVNLIDRFCPALNSDGVKQTTTVIPHLVFDTPTTPFDAFTLVNGYHLWQLGAWEDGKVIFEPADLNTIDWQIRSDDMGVTLDLEGDAVDQFANGIVVTYTDVDQRAQVLWPDDWDQLRDDDPDNEANKWGDPLWTSLDLSNPVDQKGALALGAVALREFNRAKAPGNVNLNLGYIEDGQGNLQPGWKVRAGQTIAITDLPNEEPRLVTGTSWSEDGSLQINISQPSTRVDAVLARLETSSQVHGL